MGLLKKFKSKSEKMYLYDEKELSKYKKYIEKNFGKCETILHEIASPDIHLDIMVISPTEENNYYKLITMGMGAYKMNIPAELKSYELDRAELVLYLPPTWNIHSSKEEDYWPIRYLKILARLPIQNDTWLSFNHTIPSDQKNSPYADNTKFCSILLLKALNNKKEELNLKISNKGKINFYQLFPLYKEELEYKQKNEIYELMDLFSDEDIIPIVNVNRKNYCNDK